jgi:tetraprenyl-beta-curcumene synthase
VSSAPQRTAAVDPAPVCLRQIGALARATAWELLWGLRVVAREVERWRARAARIPDASIREDALDALASKRPNIDGAALFWTLPDRRSLNLLRLLVAYDILSDFLDSVSERGAYAGIDNGCQLHRALAEALDPGAQISYYYLYHPAKQDAGYLISLVQACRELCGCLPSFARIRPLVIASARLVQVQGPNHEPDVAKRDAALRDWARLEFPEPHELSWFELAAGASACLPVLPLLALAAEPRGSHQIDLQTQRAYFWLSTTGTMLDSYVDMQEDAANHRYGFINHYPTLEVATQRIGEIVSQSVAQARSLPNGDRHTVITCCMIAMYLSKDTARGPPLECTSEHLLRAGGSLAKLLLPILRAWRILYQQRSA